MANDESRTSRLQTAREIKSLIAHEFKRMSLGEFTLRDVLETPEDYEMRRCDVYDILRRSPKLGKTGARRILEKAKIWPHTALEDLDETELEKIIHRLPMRAR